jgi:glycosyltransferase involved in cell wall biosynthesis
LNVIIAGSGRFYFDIESIRGNNTFRIINRYIPNNELADLIRQSEIVVCPYTDATQSGVVMTAYAFNKPVIASAVGGFLDAVEHDKTGLLVPPRDSEALAEAIIKLLKNPDKLKEMSNNISNLSKDSEFSWESIAEKTAAVYKMALGKKE